MLLELYILISEIEKMKFFQKTIFNTTTSFSVTICLNSSCKADGG